MKIKMNLTFFGLNSKIKIFGSYKILRHEVKLPIVFLIDEKHDNTNGCIDKNIENAIELIEKANISLVGVESHMGGQSWDDYDGVYTNQWDNPSTDNPSVGSCTKFTENLKKTGFSPILGVESFGMSGRITADYTFKDSEHYSTPLGDHPLHIERSKHFIKTLFEHYNRFNLNGNLILNCGLNHNSHIEYWIVKNEIDEIAAFRANYIRLNAIN